MKLTEGVCSDDDKIGQVGFQPRPIDQTGAVGGAQSVMLPSVAEFAYYWISIEGCLGNVGLYNGSKSPDLLSRGFNSGTSGVIKT